MSCFDESIQRAKALRKAGYSTVQVTDMLHSQCGSTRAARLVAVASRILVNDERAALRPRRNRVCWI